MNTETIKEYFNRYFVNVLKTQYTDYNGRADRPQFWYFFLFVFIITFVLAFIDTLLFGRSLLSLIFSLATLVPNVCLGIRRLHDLGKPGWWYWIFLIPFIGSIILLVLFCLPGENKANAYGEPVKA